MFNLGLVVIDTFNLLFPNIFESSVAAAPQKLQTTHCADSLRRERAPQPAWSRALKVCAYQRGMVCNLCVLKPLWKIDPIVT